MKRLVSIFLLISASLGNAQNVNINCHFSMATEDSCSIRLDKYHIKEYEPMYKTMLKENECNFKLAIEKPMMAAFIYNKQSVDVWLEPNFDLKLTVAYDSLYKAFTMEGTGTDPNVFLKLFYKTFRNDFDKDAVKQRILNNGIDVFENSIFIERKKQMEFYKNYIDKDKFSAAFTAYVNN